MKAFGILLLFVLTAMSVNGEEWFEGFRECPTGYMYIGDDGTPIDDGNSLEGNYWYLGTSPTYSCYKYISVTDINDALGQCYRSVMDSDQMEARVVSFDDLHEENRVFKHYFNLEKRVNEKAQTILTSGMRFNVDDNETQWIYLGTNYTISTVNETDAAKELQCLAMTGRYDETHDLPRYSHDLAPVACLNIPMDSLCEIRVQTVTYAWVPNWLSITLIILTIVLLVTCCMAALSYTKYKPTTARAYRSNGQMNQNAATSHYPVNDAPPKYSDVTGVSVTESQQKAFDKYKNKGKEMLAKIYVVRDN